MFFGRSVFSATSEVLVLHAAGVAFLDRSLNENHENADTHLLRFAAGVVLPARRWLWYT